MKESFKNNKGLIIVCVTALLTRLIYLFELSADPGFSMPMIDEKWHWLWAKDIIENSFWGEGSYFRAPLYPYLLAFLAKVTGYSVLLSKIIQSFIVTGTVFFLYKLTKHLFNSKAATIAGFMYAFYGTLVFYETMFLIPVLFLFFLVWGMYRFVKYQDSLSVATWILTGLIFGLSAISRPNILIVMPFLALWLMWHHRLKTKSFLKQLKMPVILAIGVIIAIAPVTVRNLIVTGDFTLISSQGGINFYLGNNPEATGLSMNMPEVNLNESVTWRHFLNATTAAAEKATGRNLSDNEASSYWNGKAIDFITDNPGMFAGLLWKKSVYLLNGFENSDNGDLYFQRKKSKLYSLLLWKVDNVISFPYGFLIPLFIFGLIVTKEYSKRLIPIYIFMLAYIPSIILFLVTARHRLPLVLFMIMISAAGIEIIIRKRKEIPIKKYLIPISVGLAALVLVNQPYYNLGYSNEFQSLYHEGIQHFKLKDYPKAEKSYILADQAYPYSGPLLNNLGYTQFIMGKFAASEENYKRAIEVDPDFSKTYNNYGILLAKKGLHDDAIINYKMAVSKFDSSKTPMIEYAQYFINLGDVYLKAQKFDSAGLSYEAAISVAPESGIAFIKAATYYAGRGESDKSDSLFALSTQKVVLKSLDYLNWGLVVLSKKDYERGIDLMQQAIVLDQKYYQAYYCISRAYKEQGAVRDSSLKYVNQCLNINPYFEPAINLKTEILGD